MKSPKIVRKIFKRKGFDSKLQIVPDRDLRKIVRPPYNKICDVSDWRSGKFTDYLAKLRQPHIIHRKFWEYANCIWGLEALRAVKKDSVALSVAAGHEAVLFYFANEISRMVATDLYEGAFKDNEADPPMLTNPEKFAPFPYREDHLEVLRMSGFDLGFPDNSFDFVFSLCSIEHFGGHEKAAQSVREMYRVLKPDGLCCISTELILNNRPNGEFFTCRDIEDCILEAAPFQLEGPEIDWRISESILKYPIDMSEEIDYDVSPHIVLSFEGCIFTSMILFLRK